MGENCFFKQSETRFKNVTAHFSDLKPTARGNREFPLFKITGLAIVLQNTHTYIKGMQAEILYRWTNTFTETSTHNHGLTWCTSSVGTRKGHHTNN
jgi:hypothetical protein